MRKLNIKFYELDSKTVNLVNISNSHLNLIGHKLDTTEMKRNLLILFNNFQEVFEIQVKSQAIDSHFDIQFFDLEHRKISILVFIISINHNQQFILTQKSHRMTNENSHQVICYRK